MKKPKKKIAVEPELVAKVKAAARDEDLSCANAFALAEKLGTPVRLVGAAADEAGVHIVHCQLGCF
ncbi:MAG: hypothetical protein HY897_03875 [Deltaproteobacteria bacterium]|nr:hypothetical protein [Deltaproteobacteria bacterium]